MLFTPELEIGEQKGDQSQDANERKNDAKAETHGSSVSTPLRGVVAARLSFKSKALENKSFKYSGAKMSLGRIGA
jgi:hypothetical protein